MGTDVHSFASSAALGVLILPSLAMHVFALALLTGHRQGVLSRAPQVGVSLTPVAALWNCII